MSTRHRPPSRTPLTPRDRSRLTERALPELGSRSPVGFTFTSARHGLTALQCRQANQLRRRAEQERPIRDSGARGNALRALRIGGIISAVKRGVVGSRRFGYRLHGHLGGKVMKRRGAHILQAIWPVGLLAAAMARERQRAQQYYERTGDVLAPGATPPRTLEEAHIRALNDQWEQSQWLSRQNRFSW